MKKLIVSIIICLSFGKSFGQVPDDGSVLSKPELDKFVGTWKWNNGGPSDEVTVMLKKVSFHFTGQADYYEDILVGGFKYVQNGATIEDNLSDFSTLGPVSNAPIVIYQWRTGDIVFGFLHDATKHKSEELRLVYNNAATPYMFWELHIPEGGYGIYPSRPAPGLSVTLPESITLSKQ